MKMSGAKILLECLMEQGVDTIFGYPGGTILNVYNALYDYTDRVTHYLTSHEQGASHAADGYYRATGKTGVCMATSGPGATNLTTGIATAYYDSSAVVFITCNVAENLLGKDAFQEVDITGIAMPITKATYLVDDVTKLADVVREAFYVAANGRPGPVLIDILKNVTAEETEYTPIAKQEHTSHGRLAKLCARAQNSLKPTVVDPESLQKAAELLNSAQRPVLLIGGGVIRSGASQQVTDLAERLDAIACSTIMGLGAMPDKHPLFVGFAGMHGRKAANVAISDCDVLFAIGTRFSDRVALDPKSFAADAKLIHLDIDRAEIGKNIPADCMLLGDAKVLLDALLTQLQQQTHTEWVSGIQELVTEPYKRTENLEPFEILQTVEKVTGGEATIVTDVGQHQMWSSQFYNYSRPGQLITSGGFGTMGFGYGAAMGAKVGDPSKIVVHMTGDGCFRMNCHELATSQHYGIPVITIVFDNGTLGMVRQWQTLLYNKRYSSTTLDRGPDFVKLAEAYGLPGYRATNAAELEASLRDALEKGTAAVIDCMLYMDEVVRPMVPGGSPLTGFILE